MDIWTILITLATVATAVFTGFIWRQSVMPGVIADRAIKNNSRQPIFITYLYSRYGTFPMIIETPDKVGKRVDSGKTKYPINRHLNSEATLEIGPGHIYCDGVLTQYRIYLHHDFSKGLSLKNYKVEAIPLPKENISR